VTEAALPLPSPSARTGPSSPPPPPPTWTGRSRHSPGVSPGEWTRPSSVLIPLPAR